MNTLTFEAAEQPFVQFANSIHQPQSALRAAVTAACRRPETEVMPGLLDQARLSPSMADATQQMALDIATKLREKKSGNGRQGLVQSLLQEFSLSSQEGVALMCLAEALLRIPDSATRDALIRDKIANGNWKQHLGQSSSMFVNAASWGLLVTGKLVGTHSETGMTSALNRIIAKSGEPVIRKAVDMAMRLMGEQFVTGETIDEALVNAARLEDTGFRYSYDMLGEAALTNEDAKRYLTAYEQAIHAIGLASHGRGIYEGPGISIKLSALHPRYSRAQYERVMQELYPTLRGLTLLAKRYDIGLNIDAEEADRLELSLDLLERLCFEPELAGWNGIGFVIQAYQKRCPYVIDYVIDLARRSQRRLMIRLVKGAYWDSEIKLAQVNGLEGYPVFTRKPYTDVSYIACARKLLAAPEAIYPQFATHNAHTLSAIYHLAGQNYYPGQYEFQCLHGMGEPLYEQVVGRVSEGKLNRPCRIYAPVGSHETLLAYLVRRLLENGANTSFVNRIADHDIALQDLVQDPVRQVEQMAAQEGQAGLPHPRIPLPCDLYGEARGNSRGIDLTSEDRLAVLSAALLASAERSYVAEPTLGCAATLVGEPSPVRNPANHADTVGFVYTCSVEDVDNAVQCAESGFAAWSSVPPAERARILERAADLMEGEMQALIGLLVRESGKTFANGIAEVREAVDFLRYYAAQVRTYFDNESHRPLGPVVCISPWNFPLAIFTGQVCAALAAGNTVLAKPAEQTPLIAAQAVRILHDAGVPRAAVQLVPGRGSTVGARMVADKRVLGVMFTGSTEVAGLLARNLAGRLDAQGRPVPLIAETGGLNTMIVDSSALTEQVVTDVIASAFDSAGQRCSALRMLCVQDDVADRVLSMLKGAMSEYNMANPEYLDTDIGPVIDAEAKDGIEKHIEQMAARGREVTRSARSRGNERHGTFVTPTVIELQDFAELTREIFGPVLHVVRYRRSELGKLLQQINGSGYGLTLGVHSRIDETIHQVVDTAKVGNLYVNRNMVGAVVGVQPFGGEGLSGTGPKAGGPLYLYRLLSARPEDGVPLQLKQEGSRLASAKQNPAQIAAFDAYRRWSAAERPAVATLCERFARLAQAGSCVMLAGPTGENNSYSLLPRERVLCLADGQDDFLVQLAAVLAVGCEVLWLDSARALHQALPAEVRARIGLVPDWPSSTLHFDAVLHHGSKAQRQAVCQEAAKRPGPLVSVHGLETGETNIPLERLLIEHALSINTAAAGGNASLMTIG